MRNYPHPGERWQHERGWTVTIIRLIEASPSVALVNPEFSCEVLIRHDSDNQLSSCPLAWFEQRYTRLFDVPLFKPAPAPAGGSGSGPLHLTDWFSCTSLIVSEATTQGLSRQKWCMRLMRFHAP